VTQQRRRRTCAWPGGCNQKARRKLGGLCPEHARASLLDELASEYLRIADQVDVLAAEVAGRWEGAWPEPAGPRELRRLAIDCRRIARKRLAAQQDHLTHEVQQLDLADRRPSREVLTDDPAQIRRKRIVEEGLLELWPGRPSTHTRITQDEWTQLRAVLGLLSPTERRALWLVKGQGRTHRQAAYEMKTSSGNIYNLLARAEAKLSAWRGGDPAQAQFDFEEGAAD
jgi:DNA-directed RNA polymerase specialized sigma24 family protein